MYVINTACVTVADKRELCDVMDTTRVTVMSESDVKSSNTDFALMLKIEATPECHERTSWFT